MSSPFKDLPRKIKQGKLKINNVFSEENIQRLFGHEAAEDEDVERLKEYYFKNDVFEQVSANLKLRILVGHKGIGKSALFKIAASEDIDNGFLPIEIKPNDVIGIANTNEGFLELIQIWDEGIRSIIADKVIRYFSEESSKKILPNVPSTGKFISTIIDTIKGTTIADKAKKSIFDNFQKNKRINVYIDDLDRGWEGKRQDIVRISALLNAIRDISNELNNVHFKVSLRSDVYYLVRTSDESTDKIEGSVVWYTWHNTQILALLAKRVETFYGREISEEDLIVLHQQRIATYLKPIMTQTFEGVGKWNGAPIYRILMSLVRNRPRDLVKLCSLAARQARKNNHNTITTEDFQGIFDSYSLERIQDIENEFRSELPDIRRLLFSLKPSVKKSKKYSDSYVYSTGQIESKISSVSADTPFYFSKTPDSPASANELLFFLYKINFLTARRINKDNITVRKTFEENKYLTASFVDFGFGWEVHPAYRWALEPDDHLSIYNRLELLDFE
ncbi:P-loop ATPase, Sll1717 family [Desulfocurvus sp. DL9XJH121]